MSFNVYKLYENGNELNCYFFLTINRPSFMMGSMANRCLKYDQGYIKRKPLFYNIIPTQNYDYKWVKEFSPDLERKLLDKCVKSMNQ